MKILLFKIGALGDVLMTTPFLRQVRKNYPEARIDYLVGGNTARILEDNENLDNIIKLDDQLFFEKKILKFFKLVKKVREKDYDLIFVLDKHWIFKLASWLFNIPERIGFARKGNGWFLTKSVRYERVRHERFYYLDLLNEVGKVDYDDFEIDFDIEGKEKKVEWDDYTVLINSGGKNAGEEGNIRRMPDKLFKKLVEKIDGKIVFLGSKGEREYYEKFVNENCKNLTGKTSLKEAAKVLKKAKKIITTDCGLMHIAAAVNDNIISVFGPTNPARKAPLKEKAKSVWKDQGIYEENYELYGKKPKEKFFNKLTVEDISNVQS